VERQRERERDRERERCGQRGRAAYVIARAHARPPHVDVASPVGCTCVVQCPSPGHSCLVHIPQVQLRPVFQRFEPRWQFVHTPRRHLRHPHHGVSIVCRSGVARRCVGLSRRDETVDAQAKEFIHLIELQGSPCPWLPTQAVVAAPRVLPLPALHTLTLREGGWVGREVGEELASAGWTSGRTTHTRVRVWWAGSPRFTQHPPLPSKNGSLLPPRPQDPLFRSRHACLARPAQSLSSGPTASNEQVRGMARALVQGNTWREASPFLHIDSTHAASAHRSLS
jgi:hypothetical protein